MTICEMTVTKSRREDQLRSAAGQTLRCFTVALPDPITGEAMLTENEMTDFLDQEAACGITCDGRTSCSLTYNEED